MATSHGIPKETIDPTQGTIVTCSVSERLGEWLAQRRGTLAISAYQANKLVFVGWNGQQVSLMMRQFSKPLGLAVQGRQMALACRHELLLFANDAALAGEYLRPGQYDALYLPRAAYFTGDLHTHDVAFGSEGLWLVNTRFSCLALTSAEFSFVPRWQPKFISRLTPDDRCHLNGLGLYEGRPVYVTALGETDEPGGWRANKGQGGVLVHVESGEIALRGLCMPHSPRYHNGHWWLLSSGTGELWQVDPKRGQHTVVCALPSFVRGLCFVDDFAVIGMSRVREKHIFSNLPVQEQFEQLICGAAIVDLRSGELAAQIEFTAGCTEVYDTQFLAGILRPNVLNLEKSARGTPSAHRGFLIGCNPSEWMIDTINSPSDLAPLLRPVKSDAAPGTLLAISYLGREEPEHDETFATAVFILRYLCAADGGSSIVATLRVPLGEPPAAGWPVSVWAHGLGDPAADFRRWPFVGSDWRNARGTLAGRWANRGIATLTPWMPGAGPSEPYATYSPLSVARNAWAVIDGCTALAQLPQDARLAGLDLSRLVLRADCVATPMLVRLAAEWKSHPALAGLRAMVVDDFQPSYAYGTLYLNRLTLALRGPAPAAAVSIWVRARWSESEVQGVPLTTFFQPRAIELFSRPMQLPVGERAQIYGLPLARFDTPSIASLLLQTVTTALGRTPSGQDLCEWVYTDESLRWMSLTTLEGLVKDPYYLKYCASSDPYFPESITPFAPGVPLLVIGRSDPTPIYGLPSLADRYQHLTVPRVRTLRSWGWDVGVFQPEVDGGTSFLPGPAQKWTLGELRGFV